MAQTRDSQKLLLQFLEPAKSFNEDIEPVRVLRANVYRIGRANVLVRVASDTGRRYFFGLNYITAEEIYNLSNSFVAFVCGSVDNTIFLPTEVLIENLPNISHDRNGEYKINFTKELSLALKGRGERFDCSSYVNNWQILLHSQYARSKVIDPTESFHTVIQGRLIEIGNIRGFQTYSPDKSKKFNKQRLERLTSVPICPDLQFTDPRSLKKIDVIWFRKTNDHFYPEHAFEVEISTGGWSGFGRLATLREYRTRLYIVSSDVNRFNQVRESFQELKERYHLVNPENVGLLYSAERNLISMRRQLDL